MQVKVVEKTDGLTSETTIFSCEKLVINHVGVTNTGSIIVSTGNNKEVVHYPYGAIVTAYSDNSDAVILEVDLYAEESRLEVLKANKG